MLNPLFLVSPPEFAVRNSEPRRCRPGNGRPRFCSASEIFRFCRSGSPGSCWKKRN